MIPPPDPLRWFVRIVVSAACAVIFVSCASVQDTARDTAHVRAHVLADRLLVLDSHLDVPYRLMTRMVDISERTFTTDFDYVRAREGGLKVAFCAVYTPQRFEASGGSKDHALGQIALTEGLAQRWPSKFCDRHHAGRDPCTAGRRSCSPCARYGERDPAGGRYGQRPVLLRPWDTLHHARPYPRKPARGCFVRHDPSMERIESVRQGCGRGDEPDRHDDRCLAHVRQCLLPDGAAFACTCRGDAFLVQGVHARFRTEHERCDDPDACGERRCHSDQLRVDVPGGQSPSAHGQSRQPRSTPICASTTCTTWTKRRWPMPGATGRNRGSRTQRRRTSHGISIMS